MQKLSKGRAGFMSAAVIRGQLLFRLVLASFVVAPSSQAGGSLPCVSSLGCRSRDPPSAFDYTSFDPKTKRL
jgi:hypothetical protein